MSGAATETTEPRTGPSRSPTARRVAGNTAWRAGGEIVGKLASLVLMLILARKVGASGLGVYVLALAWAEVAMTLVDMGFDRYLVRRLAADPAEAEGLLYNVMAIKVQRAVPIVAVAFGLTFLTDYSALEREAILLGCLALFFNSLTWTALSFFTSHERGGLSAATVVLQRVLAAVLGVAALAAGLHVLAVLAAFAVATAVAYGAALVLAARRIGLPRFALPRDTRRALSRRSRPYAAQELLSIGLARADALLLSVLATASAVGLYGAAYRLFESTLFVPVSLAAAFAAMFTYLAADTTPTIQDAFTRAIKLALVLLVPMASVFIVLPGPVLRLFYGDGFGGSVWPLRLLGPTAICVALVMLTTSLIVGRGDPRRMVRVFAIGLAMNVVANLVLVPTAGATGAAAAMLGTEAVMTVVGLAAAGRAVGGLQPARMAVGPVVAGVVMAAPMVALHAHLALALPAGVLVYLLALVGVELLVAPGDVRGVLELVRRRTGAKEPPGAVD